MHYVNSLCFRGQQVAAHYTNDRQSEAATLFSDLSKSSLSQASAEVPLRSSGLRMDLFALLVLPV
jgi:hypothetical protein